MNPGGGPPDDEGWVDGEPGAVVRPYTLTGGRTRSTADGFDLVAFVMTVASALPAARLHPEHHAVLAACHTPLSVAEVASHLDLPVGVARVLLGDLLDRHLIEIRQPADRRRPPGRPVLQAVREGLRVL